MPPRAAAEMTGVTGKRKREVARSRPSAFKKAATGLAVDGKQKQKATVLDPKATKPKAPQAPAAKKAAETTNGVAKAATSQDVSVQIVTGSYERVLHGFSATIPSERLNGEVSEDAEQISYADTFLFAAHASSIRSLAISPATASDKRFLATGSSDERINLYSVSTVPPTKSRKQPVATLSGTTIAENRSNQTLGSLIHHDRAITSMHFPAKGKLFSGAEDNTVGITRTRDWTLLSTLKAPIPKLQGRPSGDTAAPGEVPTGINDFAIHPSEKLMLSVSRGERCMRLWNLMTGKKAGVLNFDRESLAKVKETKYSSGEGRKVLWDAAGQNYVVGFERGAVLFTMESEPVGFITPSPSTKLHQMKYLPTDSGRSILAISTEDGRILLFETISTAADSDKGSEKQHSPSCTFVAQLGGAFAGVSGRIKDFEAIALPSGDFVIVTASSDGAIRTWTLSNTDIKAQPATNGDAKAEGIRQVGKLIGTHETGNRITCLGAFIMDGESGNNAVDLDEASVGSQESDGSDDAE